MTFTAYEMRKTIDGHLNLRTASHEFLQFPAGEAHVKFQPNASTQVSWLAGAEGGDLMMLAMWADAVKRNRLKGILFLPYLPGARADRGVPLGAKVYADFVNSLDLDRVITVDPHSDVAPALYDRLTVIDIDELSVWSQPVVNGTFNAIIAPDIGARKRAEKVAARLKLPVVQAQKHRDFATGKLSGFSCDALSNEQRKGRLLLVDDICDGGGTFLGLADHLKGAGITREQLGLWVTHGIFSQGVDRLQERFAYIGTTDSHHNTYFNSMGNVHRVPLLSLLKKIIIDHQY